VLFLAAVLAESQAESWAPEAVIDEAAQLHVTAEGLDAITDILPALVPESLPVDDVSQEDGYWCFNYVFELANIDVGIEIVDASITPGNGVLDLTVDLMVNVNDASNKFNIYYEVACLGGDCPGYVDPFPVTVEGSIALEVVEDETGAKTLDATVALQPPIYSDLEDYLQLDCWIGDLEEVLGWFGLSLYELILGLVEGQIEGLMEDLAPELEAMIEDLFTQATIEQDLEVGDAVLHLQLEPNDLVIEPSGVAVIMSGSASAEPSDCIEGYDPGGSLRTDSLAPGFPDIPAGTHAAITLSDDFTNQLLYAAHRGGVLCYELSGQEPLPIDTSLLGLIAGDTFDDLFKDGSKPMVIATRPRNPGSAVLDGPHDVGLTLEDFGLNMYGEVDDRMALVVGLGLDVDAGMDMVFDGNTGELAMELALSSENVTPHVTHNELMVGTDEAILENFAGAFDTILDTVVGSLLGDALAFGLPSFEGVGLTDLRVEAAGPDRDWLAAWATVGVTPYEGSGCGGCGGEDTGESDCSGGCSSAAPGSRILYVTFPLALILLRRRRDG
jgi:hypothetical protein